MLELVDSHCHLDDAAFDPDREDVLARARAVGVRSVVVPATCAAGWDALERLCTGRNDLHPAYGLHPVYLESHRDTHLDALRQRLASSRAVAVGECGLDFFLPDLDRARQLALFEAQLRIARDAGLPVILHARRAVDAVIGCLRRVGGLRGVVHSFSGSAEQAAQLHRLGFLLGFGGPLTFERAQRLRRVVAGLPGEQVLLESDAPDQPPSTRRGQRNEPDCVRLVAGVVAELRGESVAVVAAATTANARRLFGLA